MTTVITTASVHTPSATTARSPLPFRLGLVAMAVGWTAVAFVHPDMSPDAVGELNHHMGRWMGVHVAQPFLAAGLAAILWYVLRDNTTRAARLVRGLLPIYLVTFAAFDAVVGLAAGLAVDSGRAGEEAARHIIDSPIAGDFSVITNIATLSLVTIISATAIALKKAGADTLTWSLMLVGLLVGAHSGFPVAIGAAAIAMATYRAAGPGANR